MENTKFTTIGIKAVDPRTDDDNLIIKEMGNSRSDYMEQIHAQFEKIFDIMASMQEEITEGNGSRYDFCVEDTKSQHQIVAATTQAATNPASLANLESSLANDLPPWVCSHENNIEECCFVEAPLPTPFLSQPPKCSHFMPPLLASDHKIEEKSGYSHDVSVFMEKIEVDIAEIGYGISSNTLRAIVEKEIVLNHFIKVTSSETMKLLENGWVPIGFYGVFNDPNVQNYLFLNKCFEVRKVNGGPNLNFRYRRKTRWSRVWTAEWLNIIKKLKEQFVNVLNDLFFAYHTEGDESYALCSNSTFPLRNEVENYTWYLQSGNCDTEKFYGKTIKFPAYVVINKNWFKAALNCTSGYASIGTGWKIFQDDPLLSIVGLDWKAVVSLAFRMKPLLDMSASKSLPSWRIKLSFESYFSFLNRFYVVTIGSFGVEDGIQATEPILVFKGLLGYSFTWNVRGRLVELGTMFLKKGSYVVWKWMVWDQIWFCGIIGIHPASESFKDDGLTAITSRWNGTCREIRKEINLSHCKRKLMGARWYIKDYEAEFGSLYTKDDAEFLSAPDAEGRGTHTSSITAGDMVENVSFSGLARGGALSARFAIYQVFWATCGCSLADIFVAFDDAIRNVVNDVTVVVGLFAIVNFGTLVLGHLQLSRGDTTLSRGEYCRVHGYGVIGVKMGSLGLGDLGEIREDRREERGICCAASYREIRGREVE